MLLPITPLMPPCKYDSNTRQFHTNWLATPDDCIPKLLLMERLLSSWAFLLCVVNLQMPAKAFSCCFLWDLSVRASWSAAFRSKALAMLLLSLLRGVGVLDFRSEAESGRPFEPEGTPAPPVDVCGFCTAELLPCGLVDANLRICGFCSKAWRCASSESLSANADLAFDCAMCEGTGGSLSLASKTMAMPVRDEVGLACRVIG